MMTILIFDCVGDINNSIFVIQISAQTFIIQKVAVDFKQVTQFTPSERVGNAYYIASKCYPVDTPLGWYVLHTFQNIV